MATSSAVLLALLLPLVASKPVQTATPDSRKTPNYSSQLLRRDDVDPTDQSWIKNIAAVDDSHSAGIGAGARLGGLGDYFCSRSEYAFPNLVATDDSLGDSTGRTFTNWACSGALTDDVTKQVNNLAGGSQDVITISSGGNDAKLTDILNECVFGE